MSSAVPRGQYYLVEWYRPELTTQPLDDTAATLDAAAASVCAEGSVVRLVMVLAAQTDQVLYGVFTAHSPDTVIHACQRAGLPAERITAGVDARIMSAAS